MSIKSTIFDRKYKKIEGVFYNKKGHVFLFTKNKQVNFQ